MFFSNFIIILLYMNYFFEDNIQINVNISEIDIKILNNKYEINLNKIIRKTHFVTSYEGNCIETNEKIIIDKYNTDILLLSRKLINNIINIQHKNIIIFINIIEKNIAYIIKPYYKNTLISTYNIYKNNNKLIYNYFNQIIDGIKYLYDKNISFETIFIDNIFINDNNIIISPYFSETDTKLNKKNILYGSPLYNPPEIFEKNIPDREDILVWNIGMIFFQLLYNHNPFDKYKEYDDINHIDIKNLYNINDNIYIELIDTELIDIIFNMININKKNRISFKNIILFFENYNKINKEKINDDIFILDEFL